MIAFRPSVTLIIFLSAAFNMSAQDRPYGRSVVTTQYGMVATSQVSASQAGALVLERGGSAIDAAIAANAVLNVTEPNTNGMGGDLFAIYWEAKTGKVYGLNASGWAPKALTIEHLQQKGLTEMPQSGIDSVTVPGVVEGWTKLHDRWGKLPWRDLFQPAVFYAKNGFPVQE
ncbi:MAG: gamma-glutamyltransferase, partial [Candidatus Sulfotelmatobacter sp.]